jgi:hypothetical protein
MVGKEFKKEAPPKFNEVILLLFLEVIGIIA